MTETNINEAMKQMDVGFSATKSEVFSGMKDAGAKILALAKTTIKKEKITSSGQLINSGSVFADKETGIIDIGFTAIHAPVVEFGRRAGMRWPPPSAIRAWVRRKLRVREQDIDGVAFVVSRKIQREGTKAQPFLLPAYKEIEGKIESIIKKYVK